MAKSLEDRIEYFYNKLEEIIDQPITRVDCKISALKVYATLFPTIKNIDVSQSPPTIDVSSLSSKEKKNLDDLLKKIAK